MDTNQNRLLAMLDYGTLGRLTVLDAPIENAVETARRLSRFNLASRKPEQIISRIYTARLQLLDYLINITEVIVLADEAAMALQVGPGLVVPKDDVLGLDHISRLDVNNDRICHYHERVLALQKQFWDIMPIRSVVIEDEKLRDAWFIIERVFRQSTNFSGIFDRNGSIRRNVIHTALLLDEESVLPSSRFDGFIESIEKFLGDDFMSFSSLMHDQIHSLPSEVMRLGDYRPDLNIDWNNLSSINIDKYQMSDSRFSRFLLICEAYIQSKATLSNSTIVLPTWSLRNNIDYMSNLRINVARKTVDSLDRAISEAGQASGLIGIDGRLPQLFRVCLDGANSVSDVIDNAARIRETRWATNYRRYLAEILSENRPVYLQRKINRLDGFVESSLSGKIPITNASVSLSIAGSGSLSLNGLADLFSRRRDAAFLYHSKLSGLAKDTSFVEGIARVLCMPKQVAGSGLRNLAHIT